MGPFPVVHRPMHPGPRFAPPLTGKAVSGFHPNSHKLDGEPSRKERKMLPAALGMSRMQKLRMPCHTQLGANIGLRQPPNGEDDPSWNA